jgi:hypothetical protein
VGPVFTSPPLHLMGWVDDPGRHAMAATFPRFAQAAPDLMGSDRKDVFLYLAFKEVIGKFPSYNAQLIGDCTSHGSTHSIDLTQCIQIALQKKSMVFKELTTEVTYGLGREIAGMLGGGDGCTGAAVAKALTDYGTVSREILGPYDGNRAKAWGRSGVPADVKKEAAANKLQTAALVTTLEELDAAIDNGYVGAVASDQGFGMVRDADGVCKPHGTWGHEMGLGWARKTINGIVHYLVTQSWGPETPTGPTPDDMPHFTFYADEHTVLSMLRARDTFVFSTYAGFPGQPLPSSWTYADW